MEGMCWSITVLANYMASGRLKKRGALDSRVKAYLSPARAGSFENEVILFLTEPGNMFLTSVLGTYIVGSVGQVLNAFIASAIRQVCGLPVDDDRSRPSMWCNFADGLRA